ncbi:YbjN domain-containing protein [Phenylobacterium sp.]|uniref:YbjN domain-containing protein n=1 Tax=Phenylobacterium sp. TaxID=1871053 RepID=UPI0011F6DE50|nr:YbjN domain-containing protein [Phenylobacterium sp.]THD64635.1 MAG: hypothetical protein E8A49_00860 [Phenylobacterium sp.]
MLWKISLLTIAAVLALGPAAAAAPAPAPAKAAAAPKAPAPAAPAAKAAEAEFDARDPASLAALLSSAGAKTQVVRREDGTTMVTVASTAATFSAQYAGCSPQGRGCKAVLFDNLVDQAGPSFAQLNAYNQSSAMCRGYEDRQSKPHVVYSTLLFAEDSRDRMKSQITAWLACVADFRDFLKDPNAYLASAP